MKKFLYFKEKTIGIKKILKPPQKIVVMPGVYFHYSIKRMGCVKCRTAFIRVYIVSVLYYRAMFVFSIYVIK